MGKSSFSSCSHGDIYLFLVTPLPLLDVQFLPGSLPILGQFVDVRGQGLVSGCGLIQLLT